jgi:integrator complex subunit 9
VCDERQQRIYEPRPPFPYQDLMACGALGHFRSTHASPWLTGQESFPGCFRTPCVALAGHTSLRCGQALHFLNAWKHDARNLLVLTDPLVDPAAALSPHLPFAMQVQHMPVDSRLSARDATSLLRAFRPHALVIPGEYEASQPGTFSGPFPVHQLRPLQAVSVAVASSDSAPAEFVSARLLVPVAQAMSVRRITSEVGISPLQAMLVPRDGELVLDRCETANTADAQLAQSAGARLWGTVDLQQLLQRLNAAGVAYAQVEKEVEDRSDGWRIVLPSLRAVIHITGTRTRIEFAAGLPKSDTFEETHRLLLSAVVDQLNNLASVR